MQTKILNYFLAINSAIIFATCNCDELLDNLIPKNYTTLRPLNGSLIHFDWMLKPHLITHLSAMRMEFSLDLTIRCFWEDNELNITSKRLVTIPSSIANQMWYPFVRFENCVGCASEVINAKDSEFLVENKLIWVQHRTTFQFICVLHLANYPFDKQTCNIQTRIIIWHAALNVTHQEEDEFYNNIKSHSILVPPEYSLDSVVKLKTKCTKRKINDIDICFQYVFTLKRIRLQHILLVFLPSMLIVILSWISFWLDVEMAAPRVALGLTSLLTLATQFNSAQRNLPPVATIKAVDIWMFMCILMVFSSLVIYALSYTCDRYKKIQDIVHVNEISTKLTRKTSLMISNHPKLTTCLGLLNLNKFKHIHIDKQARIIFPLVFAIFNIYFWCKFV